MSSRQIEDRAFDELTTRQLHDLLKLRVDVFVVEQECAYGELDGRDIESGTRHVWTTDEKGGICAYVRVVDDDLQRRLGRVAVRADARAEGLANELVAHVLGNHRGPWVLDAQTYLAGWYRRLGFEAAGPEFVEDGIPHVPMRREEP